jgi:hypothetical protein
VHSNKHYRNNIGNNLQSPDLVCFLSDGNITRIIGTGKIYFTGL